MIIVNQDNGKFSLDPENVSETITSGRSAQPPGLDPVLSVHCVLSLPPGSENVFCFPTQQEMNPGREMRDK